MKQLNLQDQLKSLSQRKDLLVILLFLFVIIIFWIGVSVFSSQQKTGISTEQKKLAEPLSPNLNLGVIEKLTNKKSYQPAELSDFPVFTIQPLVAQAGASVLNDETAEAVVLSEDLENTLQSLEEDF